MSNKNRNYNNGNQAQDVNATPEVGNETFEGEVPMPEKPVKDAPKKGIKEAVAEKWNKEHTITWSGKKIVTRVGTLLLAAAAGALCMGIYDRKKSGKDEPDEEYDCEDDVVAESGYHEVE